MRKGDKIKIYYNIIYNWVLNVTDFMMRPFNGPPFFYYYIFVVKSNIRRFKWCILRQNVQVCAWDRII